MHDDVCVKLSKEVRNSIISLRGAVCALCRGRYAAVAFQIHCIIQGCRGDHGRQHLYILCNDCHTRTLCGKG